jgi:hypothetical protein
MANGKEFTATALPILAGAGIGVLADKIVGDTLLKTGIPNPQYKTVQVHDVILVATELLGAYLLRKTPMASNILIGMATSVVATDVYEAVSTTGSWLRASPAPVMTVMQPSQIPQIAPTITNDTGGMLIVGSSGGGKQVYKPSAGEESNAGLTQIMLG